MPPTVTRFVASAPLALPLAILACLSAVLDQILEKYPFDTQSLLVVMEDTLAAADAQVYVPDPKVAVTINPDITLPDFKIGKPDLRILSNGLIRPISAISPNQRQPTIHA